MEIENSQSPPYSVLMATYCGEKAAYLHRSIESILNQTVPADDFVLDLRWPVDAGTGC